MATTTLETPRLRLFAERVGLLGTENAFKIGPYIKEVEDRGARVIKCNLGEPDFPLAEHIKEEVKRQLDRGLTHYCDRSFGAIGSEGRHYLRLSIATGLEDLKQALARISAAAQDQEGFAAFVNEARRLY